MLQWKRLQERKANSFINAVDKTELIEHFVPIKENIISRKEKWNPDDFLEE